MIRQTAVITLVCLGAAMGCQKKAKPELAAVPPPMEPVQVQQYQADPVQFEPVAPAVPQARYSAPAPVVTPVPMAQTSYTIQKGDSLWKIAERHYGNGQRWPDIVAANPGLEPTKLYVGKTIILP